MVTIPPCLWKEVRWVGWTVVVGMVEDGIEDEVEGEVGSGGERGEGEAEGEEEEMVGQVVLLSF